jgi:hypothetical protein
LITLRPQASVETTSFVTQCLEVGQGALGIEQEVAQGLLDILQTSAKVIVPKPSAILSDSIIFFILISPNYY